MSGFISAALLGPGQCSENFQGSAHGVCQLCLGGTGSVCAVPGSIPLQEITTKNVAVDLTNAVSLCMVIFLLYV